MNQPLKVCVLGAGTAGAVALLSMYKMLTSIYENKQTVNDIGKVEINCIYSPAISDIKVGESTSPTLTELLKTVLNFDVNKQEDLIKINATQKLGSKHVWEKINGKTFTVNLSQNADKNPNVALHIDSTIFSKFIINELTNKEKYKYKLIRIEDTIIDVQQDSKEVRVICTNATYTYDFVIDCRGFTKNAVLDTELYAKPIFNGVNSVILYPEQKSYDEKYTTVHAHENGWMFGVPLQHRKTWGYLYNNKYTTEEEAIKHFSETKNIDASILRRFSWEPAYRKQAVDNRILYLGNKLYFFDPHGALPVHYYIEITLFAFQYVLHNKNFNELARIVNIYHYKNICQNQDLVALNYCGPNNINSEFWKNTRPAAIARLKTSSYFQEWLQNYKKGIMKSYWFFPKRYLIEYVNGYDIDLNSLSAV